MRKREVSLDMYIHDNKCYKVTEKTRIVSIA